MKKKKILQFYTSPHKANNNAFDLKSVHLLLGSLIGSVY